MANGIIPSRSGLAKLGDTAAVNVLVIGYWSLRFIWILMLVIWDFIVFAFGREKV